MVSLRKNKSRYLLLFFLIVISCVQKGIDSGIPIVGQNLPEFPNAEVVYLLDAKVIRDALFRLESSCEILIVEGIGGVLVPLSRNLLLADLVSDLKLPTLIVARSGLGTLNHTLLTLEALRQRKIQIVGILLNSQGDEDSSIVRDNHRTIAEIGRVEVFGVLPRVKSPLDALSSIAPMADRILSVLKDLEHTTGHLP